ncbi:NADH:ubiquinone oxidoreductase 20.1kD subunit [Botrytis cinerea]
MFSRRIAAARPLRTSIIPRQTTLISQRCASQAAAPAAQFYHWLKTDIEDPGMNGGYINPPRVKRQFRDPNADWWDKQERRNYGEPVHEDNDILGIFSPEEYTHQKVGTAGFQFGLFILSVLGLCTVVGMMYPDKQSAPREFEGGLERELGGPTAVRARAAGDPL